MPSGLRWMSFTESAITGKSTKTRSLIRKGPSHRLGLATGSEEFLLIDDRFKAGGASSIRGFAHNSLGPVNPATGNALGGQAVMVLNQELRFPIYGMLHGGAFYDAGNVFPHVKDIQLRDFRHSAGVGLRLVTSFGAVRLDWARVLDPEPGEKKSRLHFSFGYAF
ncbi:BamA/TamA family outer membrane protein [Acidobacteriota bacterium]